MNCDDFHERLQRRLDDRVRPESDRELVRHTMQCECCRGQLDTWRRVSSLMPAVGDVRSLPAVSQRKRSMRAPLSGLAVAASLAFVLSTVLRDREVNSPTSSSSGGSISKSDRVDHHAGRLAAVNNDLDPTAWWEQVHHQDWVGQTMPTVRSMQQGVAPLGRTLMRAVTILTIGGRDQA